MHSFAQKPAAGRQVDPAKTALPAQAHSGHSPTNPILRPGHTLESQPQRRDPLKTGEDTRPNSAPAETARFVHDFSLVPVRFKKPLKIQAKLTVSIPGDRYEQEADQVADAVMSGSGRPASPISQGIQPKLHRAVLRPEDSVDSVFPVEDAAAADSQEATPSEEVQRNATGAARGVTPHYEQSLQQAVQGGGESLPSPSRSFMESRFGYDFSAVRVHSDDRANTLAQGINARAFTLGNDIFFARSQYQPDSRAGRHLLAHELTHVVQQSEGRLSRQIQRQTSCSSFNGYDSAVDLNTYNCAGLATRTYQFISPPSAVYDSIAANFINPRTPASGKCGAGAVKFWLWQYDLHLEDDKGNVLSKDSRDFHIVAGRTDLLGADPSDVYSKNGRRKVYGPGTGPGFRPAARDRALSNDPSETPVSLPDGRPVFKVRSNMSEDITCAKCYP